MNNDGEQKLHAYFNMIMSVLPTALSTTDYNGKIINLYDNYQDNSTLLTKVLVTNLLEERRLELNQNTNYPIIYQYGVSRNYNWLSFFDKLDCKILPKSDFSYPVIKALFLPHLLSVPIISMLNIATAFSGSICLEKYKLIVYRWLNL